MKSLILDYVVLLCSYSYFLLSTIIWKCSCFMDFICWVWGLIMLLKWLLCGMGRSICLAHFIWEELMMLSCIMHSSSIALKFRRDLWSDRTGTLSIICCPRRGMMQLHILRDMEAEVIIASVAMCIHGRGVEFIMWMWIVWIFTLWFFLALSN